MLKFKRYNLLILILIMLLSVPIFSNAGKGNKELNIPNLVIVETTDNNITLSWNNIKHATGYRIYYRLLGDTSFSIAGNALTTSFIHYNLSPNTTYEYYVEAYNKFNISEKSNVLKITTTQSIVIEPNQDQESGSEEPTEEPIINDPETNSQNMTILGYATYYYNGDESSLNTIKNNSSLLDGIITHTYTSDGEGNLSGLVPISQLEYAISNNIKIYTSVTNGFKGEISNQILSSSLNRQNLINNIKTEIIKYGLDGVNMDMEGIYYFDRDNYSLFMKELYETLSPLGYEVSIAVPAKTWDNPVNSWNGAFDYNELSLYSDKIVIMTYDEHWGGGEPGPIASINWVDNVSQYALTTIPKDKIVIGLAAYGYDWSSNPYRAYGISKCYDIANANNATINWDNESQSPYYHYTDINGINHTVWFENEYSIRFKLKLVDEYGLRGVAIWRLGLENQAYLDSLRDYRY